MFVILGRKIIPDVIAERVGPEGARGVGLNLIERVAPVGREKVILEKVGLHDGFSKPRFAVS